MAKKKRSIGAYAVRTVIGPRNYDNIRARYPRFMAQEFPELSFDFSDDLGKIDFKKIAKKIGAGALKIVKNPAILGVLSKAVSFIPGVGPIVSTALDGASKLIAKIPGVANITKAMDELKKTGLQNVKTGSVVQLSPDAQKVAQALKQISETNPSIKANDIVAGVVQDVKKGMDPEKIEKEIKKDVQEKVQEQIKQNIEKTAIEKYEKETGEKATPEEKKEIKEQTQDQVKEYSLFLDLGRDEPTPETELLSARKKTELLFDKTMKYLNDVNILIRDRVNKVDKDLATRLKGIAYTIYTDLRQLYMTAYGKDIPVIYRMKESFLGADPVMVKSANKKVSAKIPIDQALSINGLMQKNCQAIYDRISQVSKTIDDFFIKGTKPGNVIVGVTGTPVQVTATSGTPTPSYTEIKKQQQKKPMPSWIVPALIIGSAGVGAFFILKKKKFFKKRRPVTA